MSAGVSEQRIKGQGNQGKNVEERSIPWSQQVDEAFEVVSSPTETNVQGPASSGTQFQYPPFNSKDGNSGPDNYQNNNRRHNHQNEGNQSFNYYSKKYENENSGKHHVNSNHTYNKRPNNYDDSYKPMRNNIVHRTNNDNVKTNIQRGLQNLSLENERTTNNKGYIAVSLDQQPNSSESANKNKAIPNTEQQNSAVKQMTWASVASQPAKPTLRSNLISSTLKKKGPGMPPPPMVPGKHNMDINTWDTPKNGPTLVPPPLPAVIPAPIVEPTIFSQNKNNSSEEKTGAANNNENGTQKQKIGLENPDQFENRTSNNNWTATYQQQNKLFERNNQQQGTKGNSNENSARPPWVPQFQHQLQHLHSQNNQSQLPTNQINSRNISSANYSRAVDVVNNPSYNRQDSANNSYQVSRSPHQIEPPLASSPTPSNDSLTTMNEMQAKRQKNYNPPELDIEKAQLARFFVIKSYSEDDIYRSIKYEIWCSTNRGNQRLDEAFQERQREGGYIYLLFSVNCSKHFCGVAQMMSPVDYNSISNVWSLKKWKGTFKVKWLYVKDVPNYLIKWIHIEANDNKPVTNSRDTQEVPNHQGVTIMTIIHEYKHTTTLFEDFSHYKQRQEDEKVIKKHGLPSSNVNVRPTAGTSRSRFTQRSGGGDFNRGDSYDNNKNNSYHRERKSFNRGYQNNYDNRRSNENSRNLQDGGPSPVNHNNNRDNNCGDCYNSRNTGFRNNYNRRDERNDDNSSNSVENCGLSGSFSHRGDNRTLGGSFRERDRESYKRKGGGWRSNQRSIDMNEKGEN